MLFRYGRMLIRFVSTILPNCLLGLIVFGYSAGFKGALKAWVRFPPLLMVQAAAPFILTAKQAAKNNSHNKDEFEVEKEKVLKGNYTSFSYAMFMFYNICIKYLQKDSKVPHK